MPDLRARFWDKVRVGDGCWEWSASTNKGRGQISIGNHKPRSAARVSWELNRGIIPAGLHVCHHCDNPLCVRPGHLFLGTQAANMRDMREKGRGKAPPAACRGESNVTARLTEESVREIKRSGLTYVTLARQYGVSLATIGHIKSGRNWAHVAA